MQYIAFIHNNTASMPTADEWERFFSEAKESGMFKGGSEIGLRHMIGQKDISNVLESVGGYMRFDSDDIVRLRELLEKHPVVIHGGTIELCEMPRS